MEIYPINADHGAGICTSGKLTVCELEAMATEIVDLPNLKIVIFHSSVKRYRIAIREAWCWNMHTNICHEISQFCRFLYTSTMVRIWDMT